MRGAATKAMSDIVEERQRSRCPPAAAPLRAVARRLAGFVARSSHTAPGIARRSRLASGPGGLQQNVKLFLREPLATESQSRRGSSLCVSAAEHLWMAKNCGRIFFYENERTAVANDCGRELSLSGMARVCLPEPRTVRRCRRGRVD